MKVDMKHHVKMRRAESQFLNESLEIFEEGILIMHIVMSCSSLVVYMSAKDIIPHEPETVLRYLGSDEDSNYDVTQYIKRLVPAMYNISMEHGLNVWEAMRILSDYATRNINYAIRDIREQNKELTEDK